MHKTIPIQGRLSICSFASLVRAYEREGVRLHSKSDVLYRAVEQLSALYARKHEVEPFADVREAIEYLEAVGLSLGTTERMALQLRKVEADAAYFAETGEEIGRPITKKQLSQMSPEELRAAAERALAAMRASEEE